MKTTVIVPNYNGMTYLPGCLAALESLDEEFAVCVVDNGSTDGSVAFLRDYRGRKPTEVVYLPENTGFCGAVNTGISRTQTPYVLLLNNDTEVLPGFVKALEDNLDAHPDTFSASAKMLVMQQRQLVDDAGDYYCALGYAFGRGKGKPAEEYDKPCLVFSACGGAAIYRRAVLSEIGLFDEAHFAYLEDVDIGYRARIYGYVNRYEPKAQVLHAGSAVSGSRHNAFKVTLASRNSIYLIWKNMPLAQHLLNLPFIFAGILIKTLFFTAKGLGGIYLKGIGKGLLLACSENGRKARVRFRMKHFCNYLAIQLELWQNLFLLVL